MCWRRPEGPQGAGAGLSAACSVDFTASEQEDAAKILSKLLTGSDLNCKRRYLGCEPYSSLDTEKHGYTRVPAPQEKDQLRSAVSRRLVCL